MSRASVRSDCVRRRVALLALLVLLAVLLSVGSAAHNDAKAQVVTLLGGTTARAATVARAPQPRVDLDIVANARRAVTYAARSEPVRSGETSVIPVTVRNLSEATWPSAGEHAVRLSYHLYDASGALIAWDGLRSELPQDMTPGMTRTLDMLFAAPLTTGTYTVRPDLMREGVAWFSAGEAPPGAFAVRVTGDLDAAYGTTTSPAAMVPGGEATIGVRLTNAGLTTWRATGDHPVHLAYHWIDGGGSAVVWDGLRAALGRDVAPGEDVALSVTVRAPRADGLFTLVWDMVQEGVGWFSARAVPTKRELVSVGDAVTIYGKGWGHGIGLSQWGAQGWAQGVTGARLTGEQIVATYFPLADLATQPATLPFRVLLSAPSTGCVGRTIWDVAHVRSDGGMRLVNTADPSVSFLDAAPGQPVKFDNGAVR